MRRDVAACELCERRDIGAHIVLGASALDDARRDDLARAIDDVALADDLKPATQLLRAHFQRLLVAAKLRVARRKRRILRAKRFIRCTERIVFCRK